MRTFQGQKETMVTTSATDHRWALLCLRGELFCLNQFGDQDGGKRCQPGCFDRLEMLTRPDWRPGRLQKNLWSTKGLSVTSQLPVRVRCQYWISWVRLRPLINGPRLSQSTSHSQGLWCMLRYSKSGIPMVRSPNSTRPSPFIRSLLVASFQLFDHAAIAFLASVFCVQSFQPWLLLSCV
jgi:hypothetical protein